MPAGTDTGGVFDRGSRPAEVLLELAFGEPQLQPVAMAVKGDPVARAVDPGCQGRSTEHLLPNQEEGRAGAVACQQLEDRRGALGVRAVVEGECDAAGLLEPQRDPALAGNGG